MKKQKTFIVLVAALTALFILHKIFSIITVSGDSMIPSYYSGDKVLIVSFYLSLKEGDVIVFKYDEEILIKRILFIREDGIFVLGDNKENSIDSTTFGLIPKSSIIGKVL